MELAIEKDCFSYLPMEYFSNLTLTFYNPTSGEKIVCVWKTPKDTTRKIAASLVTIISGEKLTDSQKMYRRDVFGYPKEAKWPSLLRVLWNFFKSSKTFWIATVALDPENDGITLDVVPKKWEEVYNILLTGKTYILPPSTYSWE